MGSCRGIVPGLMVALLLGLVASCAAGAAVADEAQAADGPHGFFTVIDVDELEMDEGARRRLDGSWRGQTPRVSIDGAGQAYFSTGRAARLPALDPLDLSPEERRRLQAAQADRRAARRIAVAVPERRDVEGVLFVPAPAGEAHRVPFTIPGDALRDRPDDEYYQTVAQHYRRLDQGWLAGGAWFRSQARAAERMLGEEERAAARADRRFPGRRGRSDLDQTFDIFSGTTAAGENLRLDDLLEPRREQLLADVDLAEVRGITVDAIDWEQLIEDREPAVEAAAAYVPGDQLTIFFADAEALAKALAEFEQQGTRIIQWSLRAEDADTQQRYERQLAVSVAELTQRAGEVGLGWVTMTAGDPYVMAGTDLALLLEADQPERLHRALREGQQRAAAAAGVRVRSQEIAGVEATVARTEDRALSSYLALLDSGTVVVTNSPVQLERIAEAAAGQRESLADLDDYTYFRGRYRLDDPETLLVVVSDDALRRWGGPQVRVAASRRARMLAAMLEARARHLDELLAGTIEPRSLRMRVAVPDGGDLRLTEAGVISDVYGRPEFLTPINELAITHASEAEADAYRDWRARYEGEWREVFDPIALRLNIDSTHLAGDLTVLPLTVGSEYRQWVEIVGGARIAADTPVYRDALAHFAMAIDVESGPLMEMRNFARQGLAGIDNPFGWLGEAFGVYVDESDFWTELAEAEDPQRFVEERSYAFPVAMYAEVKDRVQLAGFLTGLRTMVQSTAPGLVRWANRQHNEREYVAVISEEEAGVGGLAVYYAIHRGLLLLTLNEPTMHRFLGTTGEQDPDDGAPQPWLAEHMNLQISGEAVRFLQRLSVNPALGGMGGEAAWRYLPVLNDFRQHFADHDPVEVYQRLTGGRPVDVFGGEFIWSEQDRTMISTALGHPSESRMPETLPTPFDRIEFANFGLDFDAAHDALRARMHIERRAE